MALLVFMGALTSWQAREAGNDAGCGGAYPREPCIGGVCDRVACCAAAPSHILDVALLGAVCKAWSWIDGDTVASEGHFFRLADMRRAK
jgi:hypothetical protein